MLRRRMAAVLLVGALVLTGCGSTKGYVSPGGQFTVYVEETTHPPDRLWIVTVHTGMSPVDKGFRVGCLGDDGTDGSFAGLVWVDDTTFRIETSAGGDDVVVVHLAANGKPDTITQPAKALHDCPDDA